MKIAISIVMILSALGSSLAQQSKGVDFLRGDIRIIIHPEEERIEGRVEYHLMSQRKTDSVYLDAREMDIVSVTLNGRKVRYAYNDRFLVIRKTFRANKEYFLDITYSCNPKQAVYFLGWKDSIPGNEQVWTQGQGKYNSHWVPSFDLMTEKVSFDLEIECDKAYEVVANGKLKNVREKGQTRSWSWGMTEQMSSYLLAFAIGKYASTTLESDSGIPISLFYYPADSLLAEPTYRYSREVFNFLEKEIGVGYPWQNYKTVPVRDFLYAGMENTSTTLFSDGYMIDSTAFIDRNFLHVNTHELAHQWFGNLVTEMDASSHWLHEGFANYYAWLAGKEFLGEDHFYWTLYDSMERLTAQDRSGQGESLLDPKSGSTTFYDKGGLALILLREKLGAEEFRKGIRDFLNAFSFENASVDDFLEVMETSTGQDLSGFRKTWLEDAAFPREDVVSYLRRSHRPIAGFINLRNELITSDKNNEAIIGRYWKEVESAEFRKRLILLYHKSMSTDFLSRAFETQDLQVRQALAVIPGPVPEGLTGYYESLLDDRSYVTLENALYKLWLYSPERRGFYLDRTKGITGFPNKNIRQIWLLLAILTKDYGTPGEKEMYRKELFGYTAPHYPMEVRQLAFGIIAEVFPYPSGTLRDLVNAAVHPSWQFREFARNILRDQLGDETQRSKLELILDELRGDERLYLSKELNRK